MCLLALFFRVVEDAPVVVGANREEYYARGGEPPAVIAATAPGVRARAVAGIDPTAGGTWLGVNEHGVLVAVTNRRKSVMPPQPRSRGLLTRDLLAFPTAAAATEYALAQLDSGAYAGANYLCADAASARVIHAGDWLRSRPLPPGLHVLTNSDVNDLHDRRLAHVLSWLGQRHYRTAADCLAALEELCGQHEPGSPPVCLHRGDGGTVSSTLIALRPPPAPWTLRHAQGPPDRVPYEDRSELFRDLLETQDRK
jgi:uncharacterized protein with NRDE domain